MHFRETSDVIAKVAFKMFFGITAEITGWNAESTVFSLVFNDNPFVDFVELPPQYSELQVQYILLKKSFFYSLRCLVILSYKYCSSLFRIR